MCEDMTPSEKFRRTTATPARRSASSTPGAAVAGPRVARILVRRRVIGMAEFAGFSEASTAIAPYGLHTNAGVRAPLDRTAAAAANGQVVLSRLRRIRLRGPLHAALQPSRDARTAPPGMA